jgi:hypothetical protein
LLLSLEEVFIETFNCTNVLFEEVGIAIESFDKVNDEEADMVIDVLDVDNFVTDVVNMGNKLVDLELCSCNVDKNLTLLDDAKLVVLSAIDTSGKNSAVVSINDVVSLSSAIATITQSDMIENHLIIVQKSKFIYIMH